MKNKSYSTSTFIRKSKLKHGDLYDYSKVEYINTDKKVCIICKEHGEFWQPARSHLRGAGCNKCGIQKQIKLTFSKFTTEYFIERARNIHGNLYDYSKVDYKTAKDNVCIICNIHGEFWQIADLHIHGNGCSKCGHIKTCKHTKHTTEMFINKARNIHGNLYDYSKVDYIRSASKVCIICKLHGEFWQNANSHLIGVGCPICKLSKGEMKIAKYLKLKHFHFIREYSFENCISPYDNLLRFDFYLPDYNICIEYDGQFHFHKFNHITETQFNKVCQYDRIKDKFCELNKIKLIRIPYTEYDIIDKILTENIK